MKKLLTILLAVVLCVPIAILSASCGEGKTLQEIVLDTTNAKTTFVVGDDYSSTGLVVKAKYSDDTETTLNVGDYTINSSAYKKTEAGTYEISVFYKEKSAKYTVTVEETPLALAKKCLDAWEGNGYWINNVFMTSEWYKDSKKVGDSQVFESYGLQYGKSVDYTEEKTFLTSIQKRETEQWVIPFYDNETSGTKYISYDLATKNKKTYGDLSSAFEELDIFFQGMEDNYWLDDYMRKIMAAVLSTKDPSIEVDPEYNFIDADNTVVDIEVSDTEIKVTYGTKEDERKDTFTFDKTTLVLKSFGAIKISAFPEEEEKYDYYNSCYYFNIKPTERMKNPPTNVDWKNA